MAREPVPASSGDACGLAGPAGRTSWQRNGQQRSPEPRRLVELPWAPSLGLSLSFHLDGLGLLFALLITGIGALVVLYASRYLEDHPHASRFYASLFAFMGAMLGVVLSDNILTLFVFWELTGFTSYLLIGFEHERAAARAAALQALIVTGAGGLALLAAGVLLVDVSGTTNLSAMAAQRASVVASPFYGAIAGLILLAAFTKSAQVPFHFWLPNAMEAPTPVSAYLHSATMVKAGVYLIARMTPVVGSTTRVDDGRDGGRRGDHGRRSLSLGTGNRPQAHPRVLDAERAWRADDAARSGHARSHHRGARVSGRACGLQGRAVPGRRRHRPRDGHARHICTRGFAPSDAPARRWRAAQPRYRWQGCR